MNKLILGLCFPSNAQLRFQYLMIKSYRDMSQQLNKSSRADAVLMVQYCLCVVCYARKDLLNSCGGQSKKSLVEEKTG